MSSTYPRRNPPAPLHGASAASMSSSKPPSSSSSSGSSLSRALPEQASTSLKSSQGSAFNAQFQHRRHHSAFAVLNASSDNLCPGIKRGFCFAASSGPSPSVKAVMRNPVPLMDQHEFDTLPPAIRRKYFSSLERLRYAQQQQQSTAVAISSSHNPGLSTAARAHGGSRDSNDSFRCTSLRQRLLKIRKQSKSDTYPLSQTDAKWFLELPETIKRKHLSPEERYAVARKCESIIVDAADEKLYRMNYRNRSASVDSIATDTSRVGPLQRPSIDADIEQATNEIRNSFRWMDEDGDLDLQLLKFTDPLNSGPHRTHSKRRALSFTPRAARTGTPNQSGVRTRSTLARRASVQRPSSNVSQAPKSSADADALYYQDPQARLQLRVYLASPQKFDEAVEFGFPSQSEAHKFFKSRPLQPTIRRVSVESIDLDENSCQEQLASPISTELEKLDTEGGVRIVRSSESPRCALDRYPHALTGNREMTLRMTLTRKDLRGEDVTPPVTAESVSTPPESASENPAIDWGAIDREAESSIRRLWRRVKGH